MGYQCANQNNITDKYTKYKLHKLNIKQMDIIKCKKTGEACAEKYTTVVWVWEKIKLMQSIEQNKLYWKLDNGQSGHNSSLSLSTNQH